MDSRQLRKYLYSVIVSAGPIVSFYGLASADEIALWVGLGGTILGIPAGSVALANLSPQDGVGATVTEEDAGELPELVELPFGVQDEATEPGRHADS